jgi:hypothetical protein
MGPDPRTDPTLDATGICIEHMVLIPFQESSVTKYTGVLVHGLGSGAHVTLQLVSFSLLVFV